MSGNSERFQQAMNQGHSAAWEQMWERAAGFYRQALEEYPENPQALTNLGLALYQMRDYQASLHCYQDAADLSPEDPLPIEKSAEIHERMGNMEEAVKAFLRTAELYAKAQDMSKAVESWSRATRLNPEHLLAHSRLALVYEKMGKKQQAVTEYLAVASLLQHAGQVAKAVQAATHALELIPNSKEVGNALAFLKTGQLLPKPNRPTGVTGPLFIAEVRQLEPPKEDEPETGSDPLTETQQKAMTVLASMIFDQAVDEREAEGNTPGLQAILKGTGPSNDQQSDQTRIFLHLSQTIDLQARGKHPEAMVELVRAVEAGFDHAAADFDLGLLLSEAGAVEDAVRHLQRSVKHSDFAFGSRLLLARAYKKLGRDQEASREYLEALKLADARTVPSDQAEELIQLYEPLIEAISQQKDDTFARQLGENIEDMLDRIDWRDHLKHARRQLPSQNDGTPTPLAEILMEARGGQIVEAISTIHEFARAGFQRAAMEEAFYALQYAPTYLPLHTYIGELLLQQGRTHNAVDKFTAVAKSYSVRGESKRSIEMYRRVLEHSPMDLQVHSLLIEQLIALGHIEEAIGEYLNLADVYYNLADLIMARKTYNQALQAAQQANIGPGWRVKILHRMADIDLQTLDWRQAVRIYEQICTIHPEDLKARTSLIDLNLRLGQARQAASELDNYMSFLWTRGKKQEAIQFLEGFVNDNPTQPLLRRRLAEMYRQVGRSSEAIAQLDAAGEILIENGDRAGAIETVMAILAFNPPNAIEYQRLLAQLRAG